MNSTLAFWIAAAVLAALALAFVLVPLLRRQVASASSGRRGINIAVYRDQLKEMEADARNGLLSQEQFATAKLELEARLAEDAVQSGEDSQPVSRGGRALGFSLAGLLPVAAFGLYFLLGNPAAINAIPAAQANSQGEHDIMKMIQQVEEKTKTNPKDGEAWSILAKTYAAVGHWPEALQAYEKAITLRPDVPAVMTGYAEALAISNGRVLAGKPLELVTKALEKDPNDMKGLELAAIAAFQEKGYAKAVYYFKQLLKHVPPESPYAQDISEALKESQRLLDAKMSGGLDNLSAGPANDQEAAPGGAVIRGRVELAPALKAQVKESDVVFLFARAGAGAPVAAIRAQAKTFPLEFELNDSMAMNPENRLSKYKEVSLVARVSKSGDPMGQPGDLEGQLKAVKVGEMATVLTIDQVRK